MKKHKIKRIMKRMSAVLLTAATALSSMNIGGIGMQTAYAQYASGTYTGLMDTWNGGNGDTQTTPGYNTWLLRYNTDSTSGSNFDYAYPNGGTISDVYYSGYVFRKAGVSLTCNLDLSGVSYIEFDLTRHSSDAGDGIFFTTISKETYDGTIYPASGGNATASSSAMQKKLKEETNNAVYKTAAKGVKETKTYDCGSITGAQYLTIMNYSDGNGAAPLMEISEIRFYGPLPSYSDCHVTSAVMTGTDTIDYGASTTFTAAPTGGSYDPNHVKYQWYDNGNGSTHMMAGQTSNSITIKGDAASAGHTYYCQVYADNDAAGANNSGGWCSKKLNVSSPEFTTNLSNTAYLGLNGTATLTVAGKNYKSITWQKSSDNGTTWNNTGTTGTALTITDNNGNQNKMKYRAVLEGGTQTISNVCTVSVASPSFTTQPKSITVNEASNAAFSVAASNYTSLQWQKSIDGGKTFKDIEGETNGTLNVANTTLSMSGYQYRVIAKSGVGSTTSSAVSLTVSEVKPQVIAAPSNLSVIEGRTVTFAVNAKFYQSVQWQKSTDNGSTWKNIDGATSPTYIQYEANLSQNGERYRAVLKNVNLSTTTADATLTVTSKKFVGFYVEYPSAEVDYKSTIKASDVFAIFRYDNGDASFCKNAEGLTFTGGKTDLYMGMLGEQTIKCYYNGINDPQSFTVNVVDKSAPAINEVDIAWADGEFDGTNLSNDKNKKLVITASATDNSDGKIKYSWSKGDQALTGDGNKLTIDGNSGNGVYKLTVSDETGNIVSRNITVNAWDFEAPSIKGFEMTPSTAWAAYRSISVEAEDNNALAARAYSYDEGKTWLKGDTFLVDRNGSFTVIVRDQAGNTAKRVIEVNNIDRDAPEITDINRYEEDGNVFVDVTATDATSAVTYGYKKENGDILWQSEGRFLIEKNTDRDKNGRTFYAKDEAGNVSSSKVYINSEYIDIPELTVSLNSTKYQTPSDTWVNKEDGVKLGFTVGNMRNLFGKFTWSNEAEDTEAQSTRVHDNGEYSATVYTVDGNGNKDEIAATLNYDVMNVDDAGPSIVVSHTDGKLVIETADNDSGVDKVYVQGGRYIEETLISVGDSEDGICYAEAMVNGDYRIRAVDKVGNESVKTYPVTDCRTVSSNDLPGMIIIAPEGEEDTDPTGTEDTDKDGHHKKGHWINGYTDGNVTIKVDIPDWLKGMLAEHPFSWDDGMTWGDDPTFTATENGIYHLWIKLVDGTIIKCPDIEINCIDREAPALTVTSYGMKIFVSAKDDKCGLGKVTITDPSGNVSEVEGKTDANGVFEAEVEVTQDGTYTITAADGLGNSISKEVSVSTVLMRIVNPEDITGIENGTAKTVEALGLPETVEIITNNKDLTKASVEWNLDNLLYNTSYDPEEVDQQMFVVGGKVAVPEYVKTDGVELMAQVTVQVDESKENGKRDISDDSMNDDDDDDESGSGMNSDKYGQGTMDIKILKRDKYTYTGSQIRPKVKLKYTYYTQDGKKKVKKLKENKDYTLIYKNNIEAGTAQMTIKGIGDFDGSVVKEFTIMKKSMKSAKIKGLRSITFGTNPSELHPTVKVAKRVLQEGKDYTVSADSVEGLNLLGMRYKKVTVTVSALDGSSYEGSKSATVKIYRRSLRNLLATKITTEVNGSAPKVKVEYNGQILKEGRDYIVTYNTNKSGKGKAIIQGQGNYSGKRTVKYEVTK